MNKTIDIFQDSNYESIFCSNIEVKLLIELVDFFQYRVANSKDSPLSLKIDLLLSETEKDTLYKKLLVSAKISDCDILFSSILNNEIKIIRAMELSDSTLKCDRIKGFFHQNNPSKSGMVQHKIDSLFKHIRDSFAHGRIAFFNGFMILEDKTNQLTSRLVITVKTLYDWKNVIENFLLEKNKGDINK